MTAAIRVLIADDHTIARKGIRALLETEADIEVVGEVESGIEAIEKAKALRPDIVLMDLVMPELDGIEATREIVSKQPNTRVLVLTTFAGNDKVFPAIRAGAMGYLLKDSGPEELVNAIHDVYNGESSLNSSIARKVLDELTHPSHGDSELEPLTERENSVLRLIGQGHSNKEIAHELTIGEATVRTHVTNVLSKLHLASRTQAALYALRKGIVTLDDHDGAGTT